MILEERFSSLFPSVEVPLEKVLTKWRSILKGIIYKELDLIQLAEFLRRLRPKTEPSPSKRLARTPLPARLRLILMSRCG